MNKAILIAPIGTEAQIVTTTIDLLAITHIQINEAIVLHSIGDPQLENAAEQLKTELAAYPELQYTIKPFSTGEGSIKNLDTPEEIDVLFNCLYNEVRTQKNRGNTVYLLCSGGRKIAAAYAMLVAQMLFDPDDKLLYLISKGEYLRTKTMHPVTAQDFRDCRLLEIPFLEWSSVLPSIAEIRQLENPWEAYARIQSLQLEMKYGKAQSFIENQCTKAERKVLELAAAHGMSNAQIAAKQYVSERTVETHMRSLLRKAAFYFEIPDITRAQLIVLTQTYYQMKIREK